MAADPVTDIVILALLASGPQHGYELKRRVGGILRTAAGLNNNLLYPALHRLERDGLVISAVRPQKGRPERRVYRLTREGRAAFPRLLAEFHESDAAREPAFLARVAFFDTLTEADALRILELRARELERKTDHLAAVDRAFSGEFDSRWVRSVLDFRVRILKTETAWVEELRRLVATGKKGAAR